MRFINLSVGVLFAVCLLVIFSGCSDEKAVAPPAAVATTGQPNGTDAPAVNPLDNTIPNMTPNTIPMPLNNSSSSTPSVSTGRACIVCGRTDVKPMIYMDYKGQKVYFCGIECSQTFRLDPKKYFKDTAPGGSNK